MDDIPPEIKQVLEELVKAALGHEIFEGVDGETAAGMFATILVRQKAALMSEIMERGADLARIMVIGPKTEQDADLFKKCVMIMLTETTLARIGIDNLQRASMSMN